MAGLPASCYTLTLPLPFYVASDCIADVSRGHCDIKTTHNVDINEVSERPRYTQ